MIHDLRPEDLANRYDNEVFTVTVNNTDIQTVRSLNCFWHYGGVISNSKIDDMLRSEGVVTIINPDVHADISAISLHVSFDVEFYNGMQILKEGGYVRTFVYPREKGALTEQANGKFRTTIDQQIPSSYYKSLDPSQYNLTSTWYVDHQKVLTDMGVSTADHGLYIVRVVNADPKQFAPLKELCDAEASSRDQKKRLATCQLVSSFVNRSMHGLAGVSAAKILAAPPQRLITPGDLSL